MFAKVYITHRYGVRYAKPSIHCFDLIRARERCDWADLVYVGDNPSKDFVNLTPLGVRTVRVLTGEYRHVVARPKYDATHQIENLEQLHDCLGKMRTLLKTTSVYAAAPKLPIANK